MKLHHILKMFHIPFNKQAACYSLETSITSHEDFFCAVALVWRVIPQTTHLISRYVNCTDM